MHIILCLDRSSFTQQILTAVKDLIGALKEYRITVIHVIDETLLTAGTGFEIQLSEDLRQESKELEESCAQCFGDKMRYIEAYGIPSVRLKELLAETDHDMLVIGSHSKSNFGSRLFGSVAQDLTAGSTKPVLIIPCKR